MLGEDGTPLARRYFAEGSDELRREFLALDRVLSLGEGHLRAVLTEYQVQLQHGPAAPGHRPARPR